MAVTIKEYTTVVTNFTEVRESERTAPPEPVAAAAAAAGSCVVEEGWSCSSFICVWRLRKFCCCSCRLRCSSAICDCASAAAAASWYAGYACSRGDDMKEPRDAVGAGAAAAAVAASL